MKYIILIGSMLFTLQLFAGDHKSTDDTYVNWLFGDDENKNVTHHSPTTKSLPQGAAPKRPAGSSSAVSRPAKKQRIQKDEDGNYDFNVNEDDNESDKDENQEYRRSERPQQPAPSQAQKSLPSSSTTRPLIAQKSPLFLELYEKGLISAEQIQQCIPNKPTTSPMHDEESEESEEHHSQDLVCLWTDCGEETCFSTPEALHEHLKIVHSKKLKCDDDKRFHCSFNNCSKSYTVKENLINHFHDHSGFRVSCQECGQTFKNESTLRQHNTRFHDRKVENNFTCTDCGKNIVGKHNLQRHIDAVHKNIRHFFCQFDGCDQTFKTKAHLDQHTAIHTGKRLSCPHCASTFSQRSALDLHVKDKHSQDSPLTYDCDICPKSFSNKASLNRHRKEAHAYQY